MLIELTIIHDGRSWVAKNEFLNASAETLEMLDIELGNLIKQNQDIKRGERVEVYMSFDISTIPQWIRQYSQHYFNRIIYIDG